MTWLYSVLGAGLILFTFLDAFRTTLWVDGGAGIATARITTWSWRALLAAFGRSDHRRLSLFGPFILLLTLLMWILLLWVGWVLVFSGAATALVDADSKAPADLAGRIYFVGYMMFSAGNGDYLPQGGGWQIAAALINGTGMVLVTLALTYLISIISAVVKKRGFASEVMGLGLTAEEFVASGWNGRDLRSLELPLAGMSSALADLGPRYQAYPILQYYHSAKVAKSPILAVATLDDAVSILIHGVSAELRPGPAILKSARASVDSLLETMPSAFIREADEAPPAPDLSKLREKGISVLTDEEFGSGLAAIAERRRKLLGLVRNDGWRWAEHAETADE